MELGKLKIKIKPEVLKKTAIVGGAAITAITDGATASALLPIVAKELLKKKKSKIPSSLKTEIETKEKTEEKKNFLSWIIIGAILLMLFFLLKPKRKK
jgi:predicted DNA repair protein MutK